MNFKEIFSSYKAAIVLMLLYAFILAIATFVEKFSSTETSKALIYYSPLFILLQLLLVVNYVFIFIKCRLWEKKKWGNIVVHSAFIVILTGALITHLFGKEGSIHIREGETTNQMIIQSNKGNSYYNLPFSIKLQKFTMSRYPGSSSPSSFESSLLIHTDGQFIEKKVSMNNILDIKGYRLFQASYDKDEKGTILSVNKDVAGRHITYTGYTLLIIGFILFFVGKNSRFRQLASTLKQLKKASFTIALLLFLLPYSLNAHPPTDRIFEAVQKNKISEDHASKFGALPMQSSDGRIMPINTFSSEVLRKLHHSDKIGELNHDQFLLSVITLPEMWMNVPFITYSNKDIAFNFDINIDECAYIELFDTNGNYKIANDLNIAFAKPPAKRSRFDKELIKLDEQINIFHQLIGGKMIQIFPNEKEKNHKWYSYGDNLSSFSESDSLFINNMMRGYLQSIQQGMRTSEWENADNNLSLIYNFQKEKNTLNITSTKISAELMYNKLNIFNLCKKIYLILGGILLILSFAYMLKNSKWIKWGIYIFIVCIVLTSIYHVFGITMRWYIAGYAPWSNSYETMVYVSFISVIAGFLFLRQSYITFSLSTLFGGVILFVSGLSWMDPQISPLVPVLKSPWLMIHVAVIVAAYGFFGISFLIGTTNIILLQINKKGKYQLLTQRIKELCIINEMSLWIGLALMTIGTFLGAVWANESWGRYWGWDPKETWALITIIIYAVVTHLRLVKRWDNPYLINLSSVLAFACVLMTYFGVNYLLSGMHSYG